MNTQLRIARARSLIQSARAWHTFGQIENAELCLARARALLPKAGA